MLAAFQTVEQIVQAFNLELEIYMKHDHGSRGAIGLPPMTAPTFPMGEVARARIQAQAADRSYRIAKDKYDVDVQQIRNDAYLRFVDLVGHEKASAVGPDPVTDLDPTLEAAEALSQDFEFQMQLALSR